MSTAKTDRPKKYIYIYRICNEHKMFILVTCLNYGHSPSPQTYQLLIDLLIRLHVISLPILTLNKSNPPMLTQFHQSGNVISSVSDPETVERNIRL